MATKKPKKSETKAAKKQPKRTEPKAAKKPSAADKAAKKPAKPAPARDSKKSVAKTELAVIIPTLNERQNVTPIVERLTAALKGLEWEVIFVDDDSADGTADECRRIAALNPRVRVIQRIGRRGLASACLEGMLASTAPYVAVMDGDMQHDETVLPRMLEAAKANHVDVVVGSRHAEGGGMGSFAKERVWLSNLGRRLSRAVCSHNLSDPMSGFLLLNRNYHDKVVRRVSGVGFKILLDLIASSTSPVKIRVSKGEHQ